MKVRVDIYGRSWKLPEMELCPTCGQPDSTGDCNHKMLSDKQVITLGGILPKIPFKYKIKIHTPSLGYKLQTAFWYVNDTIASIKVGDGEFVVLSCGTVKVKFSEEGNWYVNEQAVSEAMDRGLTDKKLRKLFQNDFFGLNNWFEVIYIPNSDKEPNIHSDSICYEYRDAIEMLKEYVKA